MPKDGAHKGKGKYEKWSTPENLLIVEGMARNGAKDSDICKHIGISYTTFYKWIGLHPEFAEAVREGKEVVDTKVENALLKRCLGFDYVEVKRTSVGGKIVTEEKTVKYVPPDVTACAVWLNNRKPDDWKRNRDNFSSSEKDDEIRITITRKDDNKPDGDKGDQ